MTSETLMLRVPTDPSLAVTVRVFISESARTLGIDQPSIDDLRLIATELLASAVEHHSDAMQLALARDDDGWRLTARGAGPIDGAPIGDLPIRRIDVLRGLATVALDGDEVVVTAPADADADGGAGA
jgi:hypothetical protein